MKSTPRVGILIDPKELEFTDRLGSGTSSTVFKGTYKGKVVAIKVLKSKLEEGEMDAKSTRDFEYECGIMSKVSSPYILRYYGSCLEPHVALAVEYCARGSLYQTMCDPSVDFTWQRILKWAREIVCGILTLHTFNPPIFHRDLKSANILLDENWTIKICDFGSGREDDAVPSDALKVSLGKVRGTYVYSDPMLFIGNKFSTKSDIYSVGIVLWELVQRCMKGSYSKPYPSMEGFTVMIKSYKDGLRPTMPPGVPAVFCGIVERCWDLNPEQRPSACQLLKLLQETEKLYKAEQGEWDSLRIVNESINTNDSDAPNCWPLTASDQLELQGFNTTLSRKGEDNSRT